MKSFLRNVLMSSLILMLVCTTSFAGDVTKANVLTNNSSFEIEIQREDLQNNGSTEFIVIQESDGTIRAIDSTDEAAKFTTVVCKVKVAAWLTSYVLINVSATASAPIKRVTGRVKVTDTDWISPDELSSFDVNLRNSAGSTFLGDQYTSWVGSEDAIKIKFDNVYATDLYGNIGSLVSWSSGTINRP